MKEKIERTPRNSSLELLRIICMIAIILYHYVVHGIKVTNIETIPIFNRVLTSIMLIGGRLACDVFVLITGYFMIKQKFNMKKVFKLILEMFIYSIVIYAILKCFNLVKNDTYTFIKALFPIVYGNWFVIYYIMIYLLSPFLNKMINNLNKTSHFRLICICILLWSIIPTITNNFWVWSSLDAFLVMYIIGSYLRLYPKEKKSNKINVLVLLIVVAVLVAISIYFMYNGTFNDMKTYFHKLNNFFMVIVAIYLFKVFEHMNFVNKPINYISSSILGIYLIHDNEFMRSVIWTKIYNNMDYISSKYYILQIGIKLVAIFILGLIIDKLVTKILNLTIFKIIDKIKLEKCKQICEKIEEKAMKII